MPTKKKLRSEIGDFVAFGIEGQTEFRFKGQIYKQWSNGFDKNGDVKITIILTNFKIYKNGKKVNYKRVGRGGFQVI